MEQSLDTLSGVQLVKMHSRISFAYAFKDIEKGYDWSFKAVDLAEESGDLLSKCTAYRVLGIVYDFDNKNDSAFFYFNKSLDYAKELGSQEEEAMSINNLGMYFWNKGQLDKAANNFVDALLLYENLGDKVNPSSVSGNYNNVCLIYNELGQYEKAIPFCDKSLKLNRSIKDTMEMLNNLNNLGIAHQNLNKIAESNSFFNEGIKMLEEINSPRNEAAIREGIAINYLSEGRLRQAQNELKKCVQLSAKDYNILHKYLSKSATVENEMGNHRKALEFAKRGLEITDSLEISGFSASLFQESAKANFGLGNQDEGKAYLEQWSKEIEHTFSTSNATVLAEKEVEYETAQKEKQILEQEIEIQKQSKTNRTLAFSMLAGLLLVSLGFVWWQGKSEREKLIAIQEIENKAKVDQLFALLEGEERERSRLAKDLHDGLGQVLSIARMNVSALEDAPFQSDEKDIWNNAVGLIDRAVDEMRSVSHDLTAPALKGNNLTEALKEMSEQLNKSKDNYLVVKNIEGDLALGDRQEKIIFRVIQELINNSIKYAKDASLELTILQTGDEQIFSLHQTKGKVSEHQLGNGHGIGWSNIKSRMDLLNGKISVSPLDDGTTFKMTIPKR